MKPFFFVLALVGTLASAASAQMPKYRVTAKVDKKADFSAIKTYSWTSGWTAYDKSVDEQICAAIDQELDAVGLTKVESGPGDVIVTYASLKRTDVDLKAKPAEKGGMRPEYPVGSLVVLLLEPGTRRELFRARADVKLPADPAQFGPMIAGTVAEMFEKYPRPKTGNSAAR
jgi:uncharacterized protein DUF4136